MQGILGIIVLILDIIAILDAVKSSMSNGKKILWVVLILVLPIVGLVLYYVIGKKK
ncbi:PLDc N-terminal domain-containing protein [Candidatus Omnitrophota bacterium]